MRAVVTEGGAQLLNDVPGEPVLAKTGTAEFGSETPPRTHAWVVALQGDLAVAVSSRRESLAQPRADR
jgi:cell division protein FtsI/penicillin-binding protein 2